MIVFNVQRIDDAAEYVVRVWTPRPRGEETMREIMRGSVPVGSNPSTARAVLAAVALDILVQGEAEIDAAL